MEDRPGVDSFEPLRIGEAAPDFVARSTEGMVRLSDYRGRWLMFFSHPGDFTPICTSEFISLAQAFEQFEALECSLLGHSVDSLFSHLAWLRAIHDDLGVTVPFPIVEDPNLEIARAYGMVSAEQDNAASVRAVYFIDPDGIVRAMNWYPLAVGRSVKEMLRIVAALRRTADGECLTPEGWEPGEALLAPPGFNKADALAGPNATEWFYRTMPDKPR
ncbi:MAG TPA: peroxiredoxin [Novosphingobium sp.]|nr:peroxiredoxin [Novosphingobium sp.]HQA18098.1 peroxiredoxin [Novosphingobium sp.]